MVCVVNQDGPGGAFLSPLLSPHFGFLNQNVKVDVNGRVCTVHITCPTRRRVVFPCRLEFECGTVPMAASVDGPAIKDGAASTIVAP